MENIPDDKVFLLCFPKYCSGNCARKKILFKTCSLFGFTSNPSTYWEMEADGALWFKWAGRILIALIKLLGSRGGFKLDDVLSRIYEHKDAHKTGSIAKLTGHELNKLNAWENNLCLNWKKKNNFPKQGLNGDLHPKNAIITFIHLSSISTSTGS